METPGKVLKHKLTIKRYPSSSSSSFSCSISCLEQAMSEKISAAAMAPIRARLTTVQLSHGDSYSQENSKTVNSTPMQTTMNGSRHQNMMSSCNRILIHFTSRVSLHIQMNFKKTGNNLLECNRSYDERWRLAI